jgi:3-deoxy-D-manno-octulosonic-acid transferase
MGLFFRLAGVVFMGKSLVPLGGQNPLEAARLDCAIVYGPHMMNFDEMTKKMKNAAAALEVADEGALETVIGRLLDDGVERGRMIAAAGEWAVAEAGVLDAVVAELAPFLATLSKENAPRARA